MKPETQRTVIAQALGWRRMSAPKELGFGASAPEFCWYFEHQLPDYLNDLNSMNKVISSLLGADRDKFTDHLSRIVKREKRMATGRWLLITASAAQLAEAFLKTLSLWRP